VPLGGIGAGCIEFGADAAFRNVTINNNRTPAQRIPVAHNAFLAVTYKGGDDVHTRILQPATQLPFERAGITPQYTSTREFSWHGLYPRSSYELKKDVFPLRVKWTALSPVIPYDLDAAVMPAILFFVEIHNPTSAEAEVAALMNWENLRGCDREKTPDRRGGAKPVFYDAVMQEMRIEPFSEKNIDLGMVFGHGEPCTENAHGDYTLVGGPGDHHNISRDAWDPSDPGELAQWWHRFEQKHDLGLNPLRNVEKRCGAVCIAGRIPPRKTVRYVFALTWYCPVFYVGDTSLGNFYTTEYRSSLEVAGACLRHSGYFSDAVFSWQERFYKSSLPQWYTQMIINSTHVLSTNTLYTSEGEFAMMESPADPVMGVTDRSLYTSIGTLLFFPSLAERELNLLSSTSNGKEPGRIFRDLGKLTAREPGYGPGPDELIDVNAAFILMAYRNFHMTGKIVPLQALRDRLRRAIEHAGELDRDGDGVPDARGDATTFRGWASYGLDAYAAGLWIAAMLAYADLMRHLKDEAEAQKFEHRARHALRNMDRRLWREDLKYYRHYDNTQPDTDRPARDDACHAAQLAGAWLTEFLKLPGLFPHTRTRDVLDAILRYNGRPGGIALGANPDGAPCTNPDTFPVEPHVDKSWPGFDTAFFSSLQLYHGNVDLGMDLLKHQYKRLYGPHQCAFNHPLEWDAVDNVPAGWRHDRHFSAVTVLHSLFALEGFFLSVPRKTLTLMPRLPKGVHTLNAPLITPLTCGWVNYQVSYEPAYAQRVRFTFDSPVQIQIVQLAVPLTVTRPRIRVFIDDEPIPFQVRMKANQSYHTVDLHLTKPLLLQQPIQVHIE
jgi:uncharacterized protein (DUF608 family)